MFKLVCGLDPKKLGIEDRRGGWNFDMFREHIKNCVECKAFTSRVLTLISKFVYFEQGSENKRKAHP